MIRTTRIVSGDAVLAVDTASVNGGGPDVLMVHATGFCRGVWIPVVVDAARLGATMSVQMMDQRSHGQSQGGTQDDWWQLGADVLRVVGGRRPIGVGHSSGGAALVLAELLAPGTFSSLILIEPILPPPPFERAHEHPIAEFTTRRKRSFESLTAAADSYRDRGPFAGWDERALRGYLSCGLVEDSAGGVTLACDPDDEAEFYRTANSHGAYSRLGDLQVPTRVVFGGETEDFGPAFFEDIAERITGATAVVVAGANHFVPMQHPRIIASILVEELGEYDKDAARR
ncbi:MAG: alpha/beta hydrolase [Acidimicrobiia bacterium]|nr:alpha/beta hydrolase [Acidimicrobiia bacterium]